MGYCLTYLSTDQVVDTIVNLGFGVSLAKLDIKQAYHLVLIDSLDCHLLVVYWQGEVFLDHALPFGLSSAPKLFSAITDSLAWALHCKGVPFLLHYLDNFLFLGKESICPCHTALTSALKVFGHLSVPVAPSKVEGPFRYCHWCSSFPTVLAFRQAGLIADNSWIKSRASTKS